MSDCIDIDTQQPITRPPAATDSIHPAGSPAEAARDIAPDATSTTPVPSDDGGLSTLDWALIGGGAALLLVLLAVGLFLLVQRRSGHGDAA